MKKVLVSGYIGFNNFGDEAIFLALSSHLKLKGHKVSVLCSNKNEVKKYYCAYSFIDSYDEIHLIPGEELKYVAVRKDNNYPSVYITLVVGILGLISLESLRRSVLIKIPVLYFCVTSFIKQLISSSVLYTPFKSS